MKIREEDSLRLILKDQCGNQIIFVYHFDDRDLEVEIFLGKDGKESKRRGVDFEKED